MRPSAVLKPMAHERTRDLFSYSIVLTRLDGRNLLDYFDERRKSTKLKRIHRLLFNKTKIITMKLAILFSFLASAQAFTMMPVQQQRVR